MTPRRFWGSTYGRPRLDKGSSKIRATARPRAFAFHAKQHCPVSSNPGSAASAATGGDDSQAVDAVGQPALDALSHRARIEKGHRTIEGDTMCDAAARSAGLDLMLEAHSPAGQLDLRRK